MKELQTLETRQQMIELEVKAFELEQRRATALSKSAFFPDNLKGDVASAVIVYDLANRMNISVMEVAQSIYIIYGRPSFSTSFLVARLNGSGLIKGSLKTIMSSDGKSCKCSAIDAETGDEYVGMTVTMAMAKAEGWIDKKGSKWVTMPELMLRKRAQSFFIKEFYPQVMFGLQTTEEEQDKSKVTTVEAIPIEATAPVIDLNAMVANKPAQQPQDAELVPEKEPTLQDKLFEFFQARGINNAEMIEFLKWAQVYSDDEESVSKFIADQSGVEAMIEQFFEGRNGQ